MSDVGYDGVLDVPDDVLASRATCTKCHFELEWDDDPDCGEQGCPVALNQQALFDMQRV